jgi:hypothetical protein
MSINFWGYYKSYIFIDDKKALFAKQGGLLLRVFEDTTYRIVTEDISGNCGVPGP